MDINGLAAVVTGGASGLGAATAKQLALAGATVAVFDLNRAAGEATAAEIGGAYFEVNVADEASVTSALKAAEVKNGVARLLVNCAGIAAGAKTVGKENIPHALELFRKTIEVNLIGTFNMISKFAARAAVAEVIDGERAVIVSTASIAAFDGQIGQAAYGSSKAGVVGMTLPVARDLADLKIRVMAIAPGAFLTPMMESFPQKVQDSLGSHIPHPNRLGKPSEFAQLVEAIVRNPMLNGEVIRLDGAIRMGPR